MRKLLLLITTLPIFLSAQTYPFNEGFYGIPSSTLPAGWTGDMKVRASHGLSDEKGLAADIGSADDIDSVITPWIGPLDNHTEFYFWYRMVDDFIYPSTEKHLTSDKFSISISTDSINYTDIFTIDSSNHLATLTFKKITFPIDNRGGQVVKFKFRCEYGSGSSYFVDIDSVRVRLNLNASVDEINSSNLRVYPVPADNYIHVVEERYKYSFQKISLLDMMGRTILSEPFRDETQLDLKPYAEGIYFVNLFSDHSVLTRKIIIQR